MVALGNSLIFSFVILFSVLTHALTTSELEDWPSCAATCMESAVDDSTCSLSNNTCICTTLSLHIEMDGCVRQGCSEEETLTTKNFTTTLCGVPVRDKGPSYRILCISLAIISGLLVLQRFAFKIYVSFDIGLDDWMTLATFIHLLPITVIGAVYLVNSGLGRDIWTLEFYQIDNFGKFFFITVVLYFSEVSLLKIALLFFYLRIFPQKHLRQIIWGTIILNAVVGGVFVLVGGFFQCKPISYFWTNWNGEHKGICLNTNAIVWAHAGISIGLDVWMLAIPLSQLKKLNLDWRKKIGVGFMFVVGSFFTIVSILRLHSLFKFQSTSPNPSWEFFSAAKWSMVEINVGIICNCLPSMRLLLVRMFPKILASTHIGSYASDMRYRSRETAVRGIPLRTSLKSNPEVQQCRTPTNAIMCQRSFTVESTDNDEIHLV